MSDCKRAGRLLGCKFEPRYDKGPCMADTEGGLSERRLAAMEKYRKVTYVRDVCTRCGRTIERGRDD